MGKDDLISLSKTFNQLNSLKHRWHLIRTPKKLSGKRGTNTFLLKQSKDLIFELQLSGLGPSCRKVESNVLINPHTTTHVLVNEDHLPRNVKSAKSVKKPLETNQCLLHQIKHLKQRHPRQRVQRSREIFNRHLNHRTLVQGLPGYGLIEENLNDGKLSPRAPLDEPHLALVTLPVQNHLVLLEGPTHAQQHGLCGGTATHVTERFERFNLRGLG